MYCSPLLDIVTNNLFLSYEMKPFGSRHSRNFDGTTNSTDCGSKTLEINCTSNQEYCEIDTILERQKLKRNARCKLGLHLLA